MAPPKFVELGKSANDIFNKGYNYGFLKLDTKTKTGTGIQFNNSANQNTVTGRLFGSVEVKYELKDHGVTLTEKWNTDNTLGTEVVLSDIGAKNLKIIFENSMNLNLNKHSGKLKTEFCIDRVMSDLIFDIGTKTATVGVIGEHEGFLGGAQLTTDLSQQKLLRHSLGLGYRGRNHALHTYITDANDFAGGIYHKVNGNAEIAATLGWNQTDQTTRFGLAGLYKLDDDTTLRAKVSSTSQLGLALQHQLKPGLKAIVSTLVNLQNFNAGGHKVGLGIEYEN